MGRHGTIAGRKAAQDAKRGALFTKHARAIMMAAKGGGDPDYNASLKNAIERAKAINLPKDKITQAIKKGTGELEGETYEELSYEGYGAGGVAVVVDALTDNKNRTNSAIKHIFDKHNGNLGVPGCVAYMFERKGVILIEKVAGVDEEALMEAALDAGADDFKSDDEFYEIITATEDFHLVADALRSGGYELAEADIEQVANIEAEPKTDGERNSLVKLIDALEEQDDVQKVYTNCLAGLG
ncbi:MAG: YebC/PmpR family DNA-binding transcriptional regulator, partial [Clostridiales Family XIII bacterium]|jgi:YebC/PmpR family DNA-binding regulatory protein|nr:YebC/PmpR family DNA-binding transcriptional regulator [Clostridiales Family XIII bacterium]